MKITTFDPIIVTSNFDDTVKLFEELGFEKKHAPVTDTGKGEVQSYRMKNADGFHVDVANVPDIQQDMQYIRINVDDFDEAYEIFMKYGFTNPRGDGTIDQKSSKAASLISPSGFRVALVKHIKDHD